jgi:fumarylacetoacetase
MQRGSQDPTPLSYLFDKIDQENGGLDIELTVFLKTRQMRENNARGLMITQSNAKYLYWTPAQMIAHHASGGCNLRSGDLIGTGTISGPQNSQRGSLLELTAGGKQAIELPNGEVRHFLEDGDEIVFRGNCHRDGFASIGFGACVGQIRPAKARALTE